MTKPNESIPLTWINDYLTWLDDMGSVFGTRNALAIRAMLKKWKTNPKLETPEAGCGKDACDL